MTVTIKRIEASQTLTYDTKDYADDFETHCLCKGIEPSNEAFCAFIEESIAEDFGGSIPNYTVIRQSDPPTETELIETYTSWGEHPAFPLVDWRAEVTSNDTRLGYWEWVANQLWDLEVHRNEQEPANEEAL